MKFWRGVWEVLKVIVGVAVIYAIIHYFVFQPFVVDGESMEPNFHNSEYLFVEKLSYDFHAPARGDVIVFHYPLDPSTDYIKRIIGLPGDTVLIQNGGVYINGKKLNESYLAPGQQTVPLTNPTGSLQITVAANSYFVMGDNRDHSADSREGWLVPKANIVGKTAVVLFPVKDFHTIHSVSYKNSTS